jgi:hypothetical protein
MIACAVPPNMLTTSAVPNAALLSGVVLSVVMNMTTVQARYPMVLSASQSDRVLAAATANSGALRMPRQIRGTKAKTQLRTTRTLDVRVGMGGWDISSRYVTLEHLACFAIAKATINRRKRLRLGG